MQPARPARPGTIDFCRYFTTACWLRAIIYARFIDDGLIAFSHTMLLREAMRAMIDRATGECATPFFDYASPRLDGFDRRPPYGATLAGGPRRLAHPAPPRVFFPTWVDSRRAPYVSSHMTKRDASTLARCRLTHRMPFSPFSALLSFARRRTLISPKQH